MKFIVALIPFLLVSAHAGAVPGRGDLSGCIVSRKDKRPVEFATVYLPESRLWAVSDAEGRFIIRQVPSGNVRVQVSILGYKETEMEVFIPEEGGKELDIVLQENNLTLEEVVVTARAEKNAQTTAYTVDRTTLDHAQIKNVGAIGTLLPGGKTAYDGNLAVSDPRIALRAGSSEMGNASFGTAVAVDGVRLENNASMGETKGVGLRNMGITNIESVEIVTGIPSVEYGDLSNGIVKINTKKGYTPFNVEFSTEPKTKLMALNKGFVLGDEGGTLNGSFERAKSTSNLASPFTAYERNAVSLRYANTFNRKGASPLSLTAGISGNLGGYSSESDPDAFTDTYTRTRDYALRGNLGLDWLLNKKWITSLSFGASVSYADKLSEESENKSSSSTQPLIHATREGYFIATEYDRNPDAEIILGPTGYWYELRFNDSRPLNYALKLKADRTGDFGRVKSKVLAGIDFSGSGNKGRGLYYDDMRVAPSWREYRYDELPFLNNMAAYLENGIAFPVNDKGGQVRITGGLRGDVTFIRQSEYGTAGSLSPRFNAKYTLWDDVEGRWIGSLGIYGGWGRSVKLPSFEVLYPSASYSDRLAFAPGTTNNGTTFYAYYCIPSRAAYNPDLKWQYANQSELGLEADVSGTRVSLSAFRNVTHNPYMCTAVYTPYTYKQTSQVHLEGCPIPSADREYTIDRTTGIVTVTDGTGTYPAQQLGYNEKNTFKRNLRYTNGSPIERMGLEWVVDFARIRPLNTTVRVDGRYYYYKGLDETLVASMPSGASTMADGNPYKYVGYYAGAAGTSTSYASSASVSNGRLTKELDMNLTFTTHIPKIRMILSVRIEASLYDYRQNLCEYRDGSSRGLALESGGDFFGTGGNLYGKDSYVAVYPEYYSTWEEPDVKIPFAEKFAWARDHDTALYNELAKMVVKSSTSYYFNPDSVSAYFAANFSLTKEIGDYASISFFANNFFNNVGTVRSSQSGLESSLYGSSYIPKYYYGLSLRLKLQ